jgi:predicted phage terminase large subunit-like protein
VDLRAATPVGWARYASGGTWKAADHLLLLNRVLMAAAAGEKWARRVIVQMPPRHGKSEFVSGYFPSWYLGLYPDRKVVLASYESDLAGTWGQRNRELLEAYGPDVFGVRVRQDSRAKANWHLSRRRGGMFTTGIGGPLTGKGAHVAIIDDPVKNDREALSPTFRNRAKEWYRSTLRTRMEPTGAIIVIQTRWHEDDLAGWLQTEFPEDWLVISLPAIADEDETIYLPDDPETPAWTRKAGEPLWPWRFTLADLHSTMKDLGGLEGHWWLALYQQRPTPIGGGILKPADLRKFRLVEGGYLLDTPAGPRLVPNATLQRFATMDLATSVKTQADYTVLGIFGLAWPDLLVLDVLRKRMEGPDLPRIAARVWEAYKPAYFGVESTGFQLSTVQDMRRGAPHEKPPRPALPVKAIQPQGDKVTRALTLAARMAGGSIYVPEFAPWLAELETEMALFPLGAHDDQVDMLAYGALEATSYGDNFLRTDQ